jgi:hypothetical protein
MYLHLTRHLTWSKPCNCSSWAAPRFDSLSAGTHLVLLRCGVGVQIIIIALPEGDFLYGRTTFCLRHDFVKGRDSDAGCLTFFDDADMQGLSESELRWDAGDL